MLILEIRNISEIDCVSFCLSLIIIPNYYIFSSLTCRPYYQGTFNNGQHHGFNRQVHTIPNEIIVQSISKSPEIICG